MEDLRELMTDAEAKKFINEEVKIQREFAQSGGDRFTKSDKEEIIWGTINNLEDLGKITPDQAEKIASYYKISY